jgi:hypothetical protein
MLCNSPNITRDWQAVAIEATVWNAHYNDAVNVKFTPVILVTFSNFNMFSIFLVVIAIKFQYNGDLWLAHYDGFALHMSIIPIVFCQLQHKFCCTLRWVCVAHVKFKT